MLMMTKTITNDIMLMGVMQWRESYELERHQLSTQSPCQAFFIENLEILWSISVKQKGKAQKYTELFNHNGCHWHVLPPNIHGSMQ